MHLIHCDNHILVVEKPPGIATQPEFHEEAKIWVKKTYSKPGNVFLEPIHRLDKPVGGLVLFARTSKALSRLNAAMRARSIRKIYLAQVEGEVPDEGILEHDLIHGEFRAYVDAKGKQARLRYRKLQSTGENSLMEIELETGRYHQIRAQFGAIGHPIVGDEKYGSCTKWAHIALWHQEMQLEHPITKKLLVFKSEAGSFFE